MHRKELGRTDQPKANFLIMRTAFERFRNFNQHMSPGILYRKFILCKPSIFISDKASSVELVATKMARGATRPVEEWRRNRWGRGGGQLVEAEWRKGSE